MASTSVKTDELDQWHEYGVYTPARLIDCGGDIDEAKATELIKNIRLLDYVNNNDIVILINTQGGDVHQGMAIFDAIKECNSKVITHAVGPCWSMGSIILQAGDIRKISANATLMLHIGTEEMPENHPTINRRWMKENDRIEKVIVDILYKKIKQKKTRFQKKQLNEMIVFDTILTSKQVIEYGLVDTIEEHKEL